MPGRHLFGCMLWLILVTLATLAHADSADAASKDSKTETMQIGGMTDDDDLGTDDDGLVNLEPVCGPNTITLTAEDSTGLPATNSVYNWEATDPDEDKLTYELLDADGFFTMDRTGTINSVDLVPLGSYTLSVRVTDSQGATAECSITIVVEVSNNAPECPSPLPSYLVETIPVEPFLGPIHIGNFLYSDADGDKVTTSVTIAGDAQLFIDRKALSGSNLQQGVWELTITLNDGIEETICRPTLTVDTCGDGLLQSWEACDDDGKTSGDGCSDSCSVESGYSCFGAPSACFPSITSEGTTFVYTGMQAPAHQAIGPSCGSIHESLVPPTIESAAQNTAIHENIPGDVSATNPASTSANTANFAVGIRWNSRERQWVNWDQSAVTWYPGSRLPRHALGSDCMELNRINGVWEGVECDASLNVLCEAEPIVVAVGLPNLPTNGTPFQQEQ
eukprot:TRINITY_DN61308_c0_g1_i1.p1 TRINITY_DN61308_c0_g1~~TRINITY_DN61308_c0_g1_i1.p1  ORF type:complete len:467 (+),score=35.42 TRINITY_DN61308_c0_g1_i1:59-1402(+)